MREKTFYLSCNPDDYVVMSEDDYNRVQKLIELNARVFDEHDVCLPEDILAIDPEFFNREKEIQRFLNLSDEEFDNIILY